MNINLNDILVSHCILFDYNVEDSVKKPAYWFSHQHLFKIEDSIHFKALTSNDYTAYNQLIKTCKHGNSRTCECHTELKFKELKDNFDTSILIKDKIPMYYNNELEKYIATNGCHRLSILKLAGYEHVPSDWFLIEIMVKQ